MFRCALILEQGPGPSVAVAQHVAPGCQTIAVPHLDPGAPKPAPPLGGPVALDARAVAEEMRTQGADLAVVGPLSSMASRTRVNLAVRLAIEHGAFVLSVGARCRPPSAPLAHVALVSEASGDDLAAMLRILPLFEWVPRVSGFFVGSSEHRRQALMATLRAARSDVSASVVEISSSWSSQAEAIDRAAIAAEVDLVVIPSDSLSDFGALVRGFFAADALQQAERPTLILPRTTSSPALLGDRLHASDTVALDDGPSPVAAELVGPLGRVRLAPADRIGVGQGAALPHELGVLELDAELVRAAGGTPIWLTLDRDPPERCTIRAIRPTRPLALVDALAPPDVLALVERFASTCDVVFVRLRWEDSLESLRNRLLERAPWAGAPLVIDASAWLDDGGADDLPSDLDAQRLHRLATRLSLRRVNISAVVTATPGADLGQRLLWPPADELDLVSDAKRIEGNDVRFTLENAEARSALLAGIEGARRRVSWQCYIVEEGATSERFASALERAAARGVRVRMLVDALYSRHEALGARNTVLDKLGTVAGVEVRAYRPVSGVPDLVALKQRNHRKLVVIDGVTATVTGRNLGAPYYTGFHEVVLTRESSYRDVPWLDCGVIVRGPVAGLVERAFVQDWLASGGPPFETGPMPARVGDTACRLVLHEGLRDTRTFDTMLCLIHRARQRIVAVNTFPLAIELQRALVAAARRGVRVQVLHGSIRPRYGEGTAFAGGLIRTVADQLVRARLDPVAFAGGEICELTLGALPEWEQALGPVLPHVHAKIMVRDEDEVAVGSANLDVTSAYWESEALVLVESPKAARLMLESLDPLLRSARKADPTDAAWREEAARRAQLGHSWPSLVG